MKYKIFLAIIIFIAALTRLPMLDQFPNGFSADEAGQGYDGYSILKTGKDSWGDFLPLNPRGFGDYKPPIYTYLTIPSIALFDLNKIATRLPAALIGILTILAMYYLALNLFNDKRSAILIALLLSISPWHIQISRTAFEGGVGILFFIVGLTFLIKSGILNRLVRPATKYLILCLIFWGLSLYTYQSFRLFIILFFLGLIGIFRKQFNFRNLGISLLILGIFALPILFNFNSASTRLSDVGIGSQENIKSFMAERSVIDTPYALVKTFDSKFIFLSAVFFNNYLSYFSPSFYFTGARPDFSYLNFSGFPLFYLLEILFIILAIYNLFKNPKKQYAVLLLWILIAPIPASITNGAMYVNRSIILFPAVTLLSGFGFKILIDLIRDRFGFSKIASFCLLGFLLFVNFLFFGYFYLYKLPNNPPESLRFGYDQVFEKALSVESDYSKVVFDKTVFSEPQIFVAFYGKVDPSFYQTASKDWLRYQKSNKLYVDQLESYNLDKYLFERISLEDKLRENQKVLLIGSADSFPVNAISDFDVKNPKGKVIYKMVSVNPK